METTILLNIATLKAFPLADMNSRSIFIINKLILLACFPRLNVIENIISIWYWEHHAWFCYQIPTHTVR